EVIDGGDGDDTIFYSGEDDDVLTLSGDVVNVEFIELTGGNDVGVDASAIDSLLNITGNGSDNLITGGSDTDIITSGGGADTIDGGAGADNITGDAGASLLSGGAGDDVIAGGAGAETITGGTGRDDLTGNAGADVFVFADGDSALSQAGADVITDFATGVDQLEFGGPAGDDSGTATDNFVDGGTDTDFATALVNANAAFDGSVLYYTSDDGAGTPTAFVFADIDGDGTADIGIVLSGVAAVDVADIV
ncbi:MAG TPA: hypothetical protein DFI00_10195, partial [Rhodospirillaceae bacterium]|nr:hypothetical protein [Rhodospirillaceae bacterium]